jgi:rod shape-determining protein MreD
MRRQASLWRRLDAASRYMFPLGSLVFGLFAIGMPFGLPGQAELAPVYAMACVFFWSLYRPSSLPAPLVAIVLLLVLQGVTLALRRRLAQQSFFLTWAVFSAFASALACLAWMAQSLLTLSVLPVLPVLVEMLLACGFYPAFAGFFIRAHRGPAAVELA